MIRRSAAVAAFVVVVLAFASPAADAHALLKSSTPTDGAQLASAPSAVVLTFTETPDPKLSILHVLDQNGNDVEKGPTRAVPGNTASLTVTLGTLPKGVYTVTWRTVSRVDGHVTGGAFAFGVGVSPAGATLPKGATVKTPSPSVLSVATRWLFYVGLFLLIGTATTELFVARGLARTALLAKLGWLGAAVGLLGLVEAQRRDAGVAIGDLLGTSIGHAFILRAIPLAVALVGVLLVLRPARRAAGSAVVLAATAAVVVAHVAEGHAATGAWRDGKIILQSAHVLAGGIWIGGRATILAGVGPLEPEARHRATRRFSSMALWTIAVLAGAGVWRAFNEIGSWHQLFATSYGQVVIAKAALLLVLIALGAVNRYRNVRRAGTEPRGLLATGSAELVLAVAVLALTGILSSVAPARAIQAATPAQTSVTATGSDFGHTVRLRLRATPGTAGPNTFELRVTDFASGAPVQADVSLRFTFLGPVQVGSSTLPLRAAGSGVYRARGTNLSIGGVWTATALVQRGAASVEVPLTLATRVTQQVSVAAAPGQPTLYTIALSDGRSVQFYADPGTLGPNEVHATFFDKGGTQFNGLSGYFVVATPPQATPQGLDYRALAEGHIVADATLTAGTWRFDVWARTKTGELLWSYFEPTIGT
ncbi:MAG: copper resistance CopC/CopD family protein [Actinomycetota bacterium]